MLSKNKRRQRVIEKIKSLSYRKLTTLEKYLDDLEQGIGSKSKILSFAGLFKDLDEEVFNEITTHLHKQRQDRSLLTFVKN